LIGGELGDLCAQPRQVYHEGQNYAQRIWSNAAAASGTEDPCIPPNPGAVEPYYGVSSAMTVVNLAAGATAHVPLVGWSTAPVSPWFLAVGPGPASFSPTLMLDMRMLNNGGQPTLTVKVPAGTQPGGIAVVFVQSAFSMTDYHLWPLLILAN
jgi:hypothetical protein